MDNRYSVYRQIRYERTYKTLGKMNWVRIVLGALLLISVFFITGTVAEYFASRGNFSLAEKMMLVPAWMENYKPETKAYIEAGALYESGDYDGAYDRSLEVDIDELTKSKKTVYNELCSRLYEHFNSAGDAERCEEMNRRMQLCAEKDS